MPGTPGWVGQELQCCWVFHAQQFPVCIKNCPPLKEHPANLTQPWEAFESTWASIPVERFWPLVESLPRQIDGCSEGKREGVQLNIRKVFLMFGILRVDNLWSLSPAITSYKGWKNGYVANLILLTSTTKVKKHWIGYYDCHFYKFSKMTVITSTFTSKPAVIYHSIRVVYIPATLEL